MKPKVEHFMEEADIGSGEKTPAELADQDATEHLHEEQEKARQQEHPLDGGSLLQVTEEQQYIARHESHTPPEEGEAATLEPAKSVEIPEETGLEAEDALPPDDPGEVKKSRKSLGTKLQGRDGQAK